MPVRGSRKAFGWQNFSIFVERKKENTSISILNRTLKTGLTAPQPTLQQLFRIRRMCGTIWNDCVQLARYYYRIHGVWINQSDLQSELKGLYPLHSQTIQAVCHKFLRAREGVRKARKTNPSIRYPYKEKFVFHPKW